MWTFFDGFGYLKFNVEIDSMMYSRSRCSQDKNLNFETENGQLVFKAVGLYDVGIGTCKVITLKKQFNENTSSFIIFIQYR